LIEGLPAEVVMADTADDADHLRQVIAAKGALAVIPNNPSRALKYPLDKHLYAQRHLHGATQRTWQPSLVTSGRDQTGRRFAIIGSSVPRLAVIDLSSNAPTACFSNAFEGTHGLLPALHVSVRGSRL
jgi:transposase